MNASAAIKAALRNYEPTSEQWDAITDPLEPVVIRAGAGSGKTAVMTARIVHLVESNQVRAAGVLGLTFTNKAAAELEERLTEALGAMDPRLDELSEIELRHPLSYIPQTLELSDQCATHLAEPEDLERECARLLEEGLGDDWAVEATRKRKEFAKIIRLYRDRKRKLRRIDYGDQIRLAVEILSKHPDVVKELRERYPVVLLDEYQDTDPAQKTMLRLLCPDGAAVTAVG